MSVLLDQCPVCSHKLDAYTCISDEGAMPTPGDVTICLYCTTYLRFGENLKVATVEEKEFEELEEPMKEILAHARGLIRNMPPRPRLSSAKES